MSQPAGAGPPWHSVDEMVRAYRSRLSAPVSAHELFSYRDRAQYDRKLAVYGAFLGGLGESVGSLLDVGCGTGNLLKFYTPFAGYLGVDATPELITIAQKTHPSYRFLTADMLRVELPEHNTVVVVGALGTSPQPLDLLCRASGFALKHLVFDYLPNSGSAAGLECLRTIQPQTINDLLASEGWLVSRDVQVGSSTVVVVCERPALAEGSGHGEAGAQGRRVGNTGWRHG
jgi:SAM-dependent methyltransferase